MIYYDIMRGTMLGDVLIAASDEGLVAVRFVNETGSAEAETVASLFPRVETAASSEELASYRRVIDDYLSGELARCELPLDLRLVHGAFHRKVLELLGEVPYGTVVTYGDLAARVGSPGAARAVGAAMAVNPLPIVLPCHRVVEASGGLGGYTGGLAIKQTLLRHEGVDVALQPDLF